jgi:hypothetical protein
MNSKVTGTIAQLYVRQDATYVMLDIPEAANRPKNNYFLLRQDKPNYSAQYSLTLAAAANRWPLTIRVEGAVDITPDLDAIVDFMTVDWATPG